MKVAFISGPYRADTINEIKENIQTAEKYAKKYWRLGYAVICPHMNSAFFDGICADSVRRGGYIEILKKCDCLILIPNWWDSRGSVAEKDFAIDNDIEIIYDDLI